MTSPTRFDMPELKLPDSDYAPKFIRSILRPITDSQERASIILDALKGVVHIKYVYEPPYQGTHRSLFYIWRQNQMRMRMHIIKDKEAFEQYKNMPKVSVQLKAHQVNYQFIDGDLTVAMKLFKAGVKQPELARQCLIDQICEETVDIPVAKRLIRLLIEWSACPPELINLVKERNHPLLNLFVSAQDSQDSGIGCLICFNPVKFPVKLGCCSANYCRECAAKIDKCAQCRASTDSILVAPPGLARHVAGGAASGGGALATAPPAIAPEPSAPKAEKVF